MFKKDEYVIYKNDVCIIDDVKDGDLDNKCYILHPLDDKSLKIKVPLDNKNGFIKTIITKSEIENLISKLNTIEPIKVNTRMLESEYHSLFASGNREDLVKIIKTTYLRNNDRKNAKKKLSEVDSTYFYKAETRLYNELAISLGKTYEEARDYFVYYLKEAEKSNV